MKQKYKLLFPILLFSLLGIQAIIPQTVSAADPLTRKQKIECFEKFDGHGTGTGTDGKYTPAMAKQFENMGCGDDKRGGNCNINGSSQGAIVTCTDPRNPNDGNSGENHSVNGTYNGGDCKEESFDALDEDNCGILKYIVLITNVLSGIAATVIVAMMIVGGIQYSMAGADPSKVQAAKQKIINALIALVLLIFGYAILQWLVPGGIF